MEKLIDK